jgi:predicted metal-dependent HD superfamily phosphohydrolase
VHRDLVARYAEPWRVYHVLGHVLECLAELGASRDLARDADAVRAAIWFHDAVWEPARPDNEEASAALAEAALGGAGVLAGRRRAVQEMILATRHAELAPDPDCRLIADIDLAILGADRDRYDDYERAVRREYAALSDQAFAAGRAAWARGLLARTRIFGTRRYFRRLEAAARGNLARSARLA